MVKITKDSTKAERICAALEYIVWHGADDQCDVSKVAGDAKSEIERLTAEVRAYQPVYEAALEISRRNAAPQCLGLVELREALTTHQELAQKITAPVENKEQP